MRAFKVRLNGKKLCLAGVGDHGVLSAIVNWVASDRGAHLFMEVGGLANDEHVAWVRQKRLMVGDRVEVEIVKATSVDIPKERRARHFAEELKDKKAYVRAIVKELGWKIQTGRRVGGTSRKRTSL